MDDYDDHGLKNFTVLFNNSSSINPGMVGLSQMVNLIIQFIPLLILSVVFGVVSIIVWACCIIKHNRIHQLNSEIWSKLPEFPTVNHAGYIMRIYYSGFIGLSGISIIIAFIAGLLGGFAAILMIIAVIFLLVAIVFSLVVGFFCKVYQVMIPYEIFKMCHEEKTSKTEDQQHSGRKSLIKKLYIAFILKDCVVTPVIILYGASQIILQMLTSKSTDINEKELCDMTLFVMIAIAVEFFISFFVPQSLVYYAKATKKSLLQPLNPLQRLLLSQAKLYSVIRVVSILVGGIFIFIGWFSNSVALFLAQLPGLLLPVIILITTVFSCRRRVGDISAEGNDNVSEHVAYSKF